MSAGTSCTYVLALWRVLLHERYLVLYYFLECKFMYFLECKFMHSNIKLP